MTTEKIIFIVGPTTVGKTRISLRLAEKINGEIVSCDAMLVYKDVDIISNKPSTEILRKIPHHVINVISVRDSFDVAIFEKKALTAIQKIHKKKKVPLIVGGSGLYMQVLLDGIFEGSGKNERLRQKLEKEVQRKGVKSLYQKLLKMDPVAAARIHANDRRRIIRALEVILTRKEPFSELQKRRQGLWRQYDIDIFALNCCRERLYDMINARVDEMFRRGAVEEIRRLMNVSWSPAAEGMIGVKEIKGYLQGDYSLERARYLMKIKTRHLAKRQLTWFRSDKRLRWITTDNKDDEQIVLTMLKEINSWTKKKF